MKEIKFISSKKLHSGCYYINIIYGPVSYFDPNIFKEKYSQGDDYDIMVFKFKSRLSDGISKGKRNRKREQKILEHFNKTYIPNNNYGLKKTYVKIIFKFNSVLYKMPSPKMLSDSLFSIELLDSNQYKSRTAEIIIATKHLSNRQQLDSLLVELPYKNEIEKSTYLQDLLYCLSSNVDNLIKPILYNDDLIRGSAIYFKDYVSLYLTKLRHRLL